MSNLSWNEIQDRAAEFASKWEGETYEKGESQSFWSDFLNVYGIDRRRHGAFFEYAIKKLSGKQGFIDMFWPGKLLAEQKSAGKDLSKANTQAFEYLDTMPDHDLPQGVVVSDFASFEFMNLETRERTSFLLSDFPKHVKLFGFLINQQSVNLAEEDPVNIKAAEAMARLHNQLRDDQYTGHALELLLVRLVFCMFADDSGIFERGQLHEYILNRTSEDGSDLGVRLIDIFQTLDTPKSERQHSLDEALASLEYVNGGLFSESIRAPHFSSAMRTDLLKAMELDWSEVSPAIFGSMFQGVMDEDQRRSLGAHYTSEKNILRVIKPLFLDDLYTEFASIAHSGTKRAEKLRAFQDKLASLKFLDPACGSGNFLVITYRELRKLEHKVVQQINKANRKGDTVTMDWLAASEHGQLKVNVDQMYGIEIEEFPSLIAQTALWLTDQQMNMEFSGLSGKTFKRLPLTHSATIVNENALTTDWASVVSPNDLDYILGNPPFIGSNLMTPKMRSELNTCFSQLESTGLLDFVSAWYAKAASFMKQNLRIEAALVSTNSITQGEQVGILWKYLFGMGVMINFAHTTFRWSNDSKGGAAVYCIVVGFSFVNKSQKYIFDYADAKGEPIERSVRTINGYLMDAPAVFISRRSKPISDVPLLSKGNQPTDGGNLILSTEEKSTLISQEPRAGKYIKQLLGAKEYIQGSIRWCLWLVDCPPEELRLMPNVLSRVAEVRRMRLASTDPGTRRLADRPTQFRDLQNPDNFVVIPAHSSENREYIPIGFYGKDVIPHNSCMIIPDASLYHFGVLTSRMHMAWMRVVAGRLESRYRYSKDIVYNNFVWPEVTAEQKVNIEKLAQAVLDARAEFAGSTLADLYDPLTVPPSLTKAHRVLDKAVDSLYSNSGFDNDALRVACLFGLYQRAVYGCRLE